ncbi:MAG: UDP-N-acetylmuramoyl-L-alanyl-D-glutamate--2,6-diaminopimelate ligase, partial [Candidatus Omnitrophica bacterium]|nr:UDP-N-acetylmuramoyl-L-alanyl-D-glutamate--2,6-diaminopimelate ligase [Candidatus Omnitrophota bacterium]
MKDHSAITLGRLFPRYALAPSAHRLPVHGIADDSRLLKRGDVFFVKERSSFDIFSVLASLEKDACAFVVERAHQEKIRRIITRATLIVVDDIEQEFRRVVDCFYGFSADDFIFIGVTGTNGKTTVATLLHYVLQKHGARVALFGTVCYDIGGKKFAATHTTPDYLALRKFFAIAKNKQVKYIVMEVSSHALTQGRVEGIPFAVCIFTNLTRDHLDYHVTMRQYFAAKRLLFQKNRKATMIINGDDTYGKKLLHLFPRAISFGIAPSARIRAQAIALSAARTEFEMVIGKRKQHIRSLLVGRFNVLNILAALAALGALRLPLGLLARCVRTFRGAPGRLQRVSSHIFVDYAHTPDAFEKTLRTLRDIGYERIICVFGCGGNRDVGKRRQMGAIAARYAAAIFITSDNPRTEKPQDICRQIQKGIAAGRSRVIIDRRRAIEKALELYSQTREKGYNKCCVLITGKGHEELKIGGEKKRKGN